MKIYNDKQIRHFCFFIFIFVLLLFTVGLKLHISQTETIKEILLSHDKAITSSLLEQGVSEDVVAMAITSSESSKVGADFLASLGITATTSNRDLPFIAQFQKDFRKTIVFVCLLLAVVILTGTTFFLFRREQLYQQAEKIIKNYIEGDYSNHLPQTSEGTIYQMFASIEQLATMLQSKNEAEHKTKEFLKSMISDISHQLKTPLAALTMYQEIIENEPDNVDTVTEFSAKIELALKRIKQLIQSMLKITRLDAGNILFEKRNYKVSELILQSMTELTTRAINENKKIELDGSPDEVLVCDMEWTREAVGNIIKNALDHTTSDGIIRISWKRSPAMIRVFIADNGKGIAPEDIYHIFKRFYRSEKSMDTQGVGLGLPLAKSIIEGQGGVLSVHSDLNEGTTFIISFLTET